MRLFSALAAGVLLSAVSAASANLLWDNGPFVTNPTGGTGAVLGQPISVAETYFHPGLGFNTATTGANAAVAVGTALAEDFSVPAGGWVLQTGTFYAFQSSTSITAPTVTKIHINLWPAKPYTAQSPDLPAGVTPPTPLTPTTLVLDVLSSQFVAHRTSGSSTNVNRPVFAYTVSLAGLPNGGYLPEGDYWISWAFQATNSSNVLSPLVTPRDALAVHNGRQYAPPFSGSPFSWFEMREGYVSAAVPGRPYSIPFQLNGVPEPTALSLLVPAAFFAFRRSR